MSGRGGILFSTLRKSAMPLLYPQFSCKQRTFVAKLSSNVDEVSIKLKLWENFRLQRYDVIVKTIEKYFGTNTDDTELIILGIISNSATNQLKSTLRGIKKLQGKTVDPVVAILLLDSYCNTDNLQFAESFFFHWLNQKNDPEIKNLQQSLSQRTFTNDSNNNDNNQPITESDTKLFVTSLHGGLDWSLLKSKDLPLKSIEVMSQLYSNRSAWRQNLLILDFLENNNMGIRKYDMEIAEYSTIVNRDIIEKLGLIEKAEDLVGNIYENTVKSLCLSGQYHLVIELLNKMEMKQIKPRLSTISSLLKFYSSPISASTQDILIEKTNNRRELMMNLQPFMLGLIDKNTEVHASNEEKLLVLKEFLNNLCILDMIDEANDFITKIQRILPNNMISLDLVLPAIRRFSHLKMSDEALIVFSKFNGNWSFEEKELVKNQNIYHDICESARKENKLEKLADLMIEYSKR